MCSRPVLLLAFVMSSFLLAPAAAADAPRKIDFTVILLDQDNKPLEDCADLADRECKAKVPLSLGLAAMRALSQPEQNMDVVKSFKRGQLALAVYKATAAELTVEDISLIKERLAKNYSPMVVVRACAILDPASTK